jgi:hypothetical protein
LALILPWLGGSALLDGPAERAGVLAVEGFHDRVSERAVTGVGDEHARPGSCLKDGPVQAQGKDQHRHGHHLNQRTQVSPSYLKTTPRQPRRMSARGMNHKKTIKKDLRESLASLKRKAVVPTVRTYLSLQASQGKSVLSLLALGLFLFVQVLAGSSTFHHFLHPDADQASHQCAVSLLSHGQVDVAPVQLSVARPVVFLGEFTSPTVSVRVAVAYRLLPERAPPFLLM